MANDPLVIGPPLAGEWIAARSPGSRVPSHGTHLLATTYAFDFVMPDASPRQFALIASRIRDLVVGRSVSKFPCWGGRVLAPFAGIVVVASDRMADPSRTSLPHGLAKAHRPAQSFAREGGNAALLAGNYVVLDRGDGVFAALCHPQKGSVRVGAGDDVHEGDVLGLVGCSGNSLAPHLHFQLMDRADAVCALGLPCSFGPCEVLCSDGWRRFESRVPAKGERVRFPELPMVRGRGAPWTTSTS